MYKGFSPSCILDVAENVTDPPCHSCMINKKGECCFKFDYLFDTYKFFFLRAPNSAFFPNFGMFLFLQTLFLRHILWTKRDLKSAAHPIKVYVTLLYPFYLHVHIRIKILFTVVTAK
jgi:hypothetical protein